MQLVISNETSHAAFKQHPDSLVGQTEVLLSYLTEEGVVVRRKDFSFFSRTFLLKELITGHDLACNDTHEDHVNFLG